MRNVNLDSTLSNLRSVANKHYILPQAKCNLFKGSLSFSGVLIWNSLPLDINQRTNGPENAHLKPDPGVLSHHEMTLTLNTHTPLLNS